MKQTKKIHIDCGGLLKSICMSMSNLLIYFSKGLFKGRKRKKFYLFNGFWVKEN